MPTFVVTGASGGIGLELTRQLAARGEKVYALCRSPKGLVDVTGDVVVIPGIDVSKDDVGAALAASALAGVPIDVLVHNAGAFGSDMPEGSDNPMDLFKLQELDSITMDIMRNAFEINTLGPLRVTKALLPQVKAPGGKVAIISSSLGSIDDNSSGGTYAYRTSKAAVNMVGKSLSADLKEKGICVTLIHPGMVQTNFGPGKEGMAKFGAKEVEPSALGVVQAIDAMEVSRPLE